MGAITCSSDVSVTNEWQQDDGNSSNFCQDYITTGDWHGDQDTMSYGRQPWHGNLTLHGSIVRNNFLGRACVASR